MINQTETAAGGEEPGSGTADDPDRPPERRGPSSRGARSGVDLVVSAGTAPPEVRRDLPWLEARLGEIIEHLGRGVDRLSAVLVNDRRMAELNRRHAGVDRATDVLAFPSSAPGEPIDVDIAVNVELAVQQAAQRGHPLRHEILLYALHGVLHCAGFDDRDPRCACAMHAEEDRILRAIGVGAVFAPAEGDGGRSTG